MEVGYKKDMNRNYMTVEAKEKRDYQMRMLCENSIKGLLMAHTNTFNGETLIYYDISSKQPINRIYAKKQLNYEDVKMILMSLLDLQTELKRFLLDGSNVIIKPEFCYCDPEIRKPEWTFYTGQDISDGFMPLAEFLIERVNYEDSKAVDVVYCFFKRVKEEHFTIKELEEYFREDKKKQPEDIYNDMEDTNHSYTHDYCEGNRNTTSNSLSSFCELEGGVKKRKQSTFEEIKKFIKGSIFSGIFREQKACKEKEPIHTIWKDADKQRKFIGREYEENSETNEEWETYGMSEGAYGGETMVMGICNTTEKRQLKNLAKGSTECISLEKLPCVLGKMKECADVVLKDPSVSRMHAKIFEEQGDLYLQDLNSTNGSFLNGLQLETNEVLKISRGDEVGFGNLRYIYE